MALIQTYHQKRYSFDADGGKFSGRNRDMMLRVSNPVPNYIHKNYNSFTDQYSTVNVGLCYYDHSDDAHVSKRRKIADYSFEGSGRYFQNQYSYQNDVMNLAKCQPSDYFNPLPDTCLVCNTSLAVSRSRNDFISCGSTTSKNDSSKIEDDGMVFVSRDDIERSSPSRRDGIGPVQETHLRYSYCAFLQDLGYRLHLPPTTIGTAMVLCHRFFFRRSHASHDRYLIATAALFLSSKSEETSRPLNDALRVSAEIIHRQAFAVLSYMLPLGWFERYREQIIGAEQLVLTTLNFELTVHHPHESLSSTLRKLGFSSALENLALSFITEGLRSLLWLQFKPQQIAAGAAYLASKYLNMNLTSAHDIWHEFYTPSSVLKDVAHQLMELL